MIRTFTEVARLTTFEERFSYLRLEGGVGRATFGFDRYINQRFYTSSEWRNIREFVIVRDNGCDLGIPDREIHYRPLIHHINPVGVRDIIDGEEWIFDPEYLITTCHTTHNAIHYGVETLEPPVVIARTPNDTKLW